MAKFTQKGLQSQKKAYSDEATGSVATPLKGLEIQAPGLNPQAAPVDSFVRTGRPNAPGAVQLGELAKLPEPAEITNLENLSRSLGSLNTNLQNAVNSYLGYQKDVNEELKLEAKSIVEQTPNTGRSPEETLAQIGKEMIVISSNPKNDIQERRGAEKVLSQLQNDGRLKRHIDSELKKQQVITNASNLKQTLSGLYIKDETGEDVPFSSISSSDPRYLDTIKPYIYGDVQLSPKENNAVSGTITNTLANYKATHDKNHKTYLINDLRLSQSTRIKDIGNTLGTNGTSSVIESVINLQTILDETRLKLPGLSTEENNKVSATLISDVVSGFMRNNKGANTDALEEVLSSLMIGPVEGRTKQVENADGSLSTIINEKQRWINQFGGEAWLEEQIINAKYNLAERDNKEEKAYIITEKNKADDSLRDGTDEDPSVLTLIQQKDFERARTKIEELKTNYKTEAIANNVDSSAIADVLNHYDTVFKKFTKADSFDMNSRMTEISRLLPTALTVSDSAKILSLVSSLEDEYGYEKNVVDFGLKVRERLQFGKMPEVKTQMTSLKDMLKGIKKDWLAYGEQSYSAGGEDSTIEQSEWGNAEAQGLEIGTEIIIRNLKNKTPGNIPKELQTVITRRNLGLEKENEKEWSTDQGVEFEGNYESSLDNVSDQFQLDRTDIGPNKRQELIRSVQSYKPMFSADTIRDMATQAFQGKMDRRLRRILKESGMQTGDFFIEQMEKFNGYIKLSKQEKDNLLRLNEVPL
jgi:hypothetical protein